ncbi:MAG: PD-(D/E)XK nuclease-like domain-containing protein [Dehalococcoidia bacterium]|jgi:exodeoxyribonuclease VIII
MTGELRIGIFPGVSHDDYHAMTDYINNSYLSRLAKIPALTRLPQEETAAMTFGRAFHCYLLEGSEAFNASFVVMPEGLNLRTKEGKAHRDALVATGKAPVSHDDHQTIQDMTQAALTHPFAIQLLAEGDSEQSVFWTDKETGLPCKCRPDRIPSGEKGVVVDVKTTTDASERGFTNSVFRYGYARQAAMNLDGLNTVSSKRVDAFLCIAVEKEPPYRTEVHVLDDEVLDFGKREYHRLLQVEQECRANNYWPHYWNKGAGTIYLPKWAYNYLEA